ncbi:SRPBCC domain-containing protein [Flaviaesturariibacter flavus]|uniref:SRPBCC domain-containing protein n=1 Tax=Flaviaesturariibacter flavus TaxID=2502780 RepID=A0A4R1BMK3_9BACT|nr:SRPBCC domain-containing protein [Flaviaesturariibacter flavus]TCJ18740.1 SRPBCC domain-containing protein [Flaviaesturariibacter flavus]
MDTLKFSIHIDAPRARVWESLWSDAGYRYWTAAFMEGSYAETDWQEGGPIRFLSPGGNGMYSTIETLTPNERMVFLHHGEVKGGIAQPPAPWAGARERYSLHDEGGGTRVQAELDANEELAGYFNSTFPKAMERLRDYAEGAVVAG